MQTRSLIFSILIATIGIITFAFINKPIKSQSVTYETSSVSIQPKINQHNGREYFDVGISELNNISIEQELFYNVRGFSNNGFFRPITQQKLIQAESISDVIENYPSSWIKDYNSVVVSTTLKGTEVSVTGVDATLTKEQKELFKNASDILINVHYQKENYNNEIQNRQMNFSLIITPEKQAEFIGGYDKMVDYLKENSMMKIQAKNFKYLPEATITFVINEKGDAENIQLDSSYLDKEIDTMLISLIANMPNWSPAKNSQGETIKQKFVLDIGQNGC